MLNWNHRFNPSLEPRPSTQIFLQPWPWLRKKICVEGLGSRLLQPLTGETLSHQTANTEPDARADIRVKGFWTDGGVTHFLRCLQSLYRKFESDKKREYGERINVAEHGSFTPLVFSACGGISMWPSMVFHSSGFFSSCGGMGRKLSHCSHQETRCCISYKTKRKLLPFDQLDALSPLLSPCKICYSMHAWLTLHPPQDSPTHGRTWHGASGSGPC